MNKINLIGLLLLTTTLSVFANTNETVKSNLFINQFETSNVSAIPSIETQPESTLCVGLGDAIALSIVASPGNGTVSYQWQKDGVDITNATATTANLNIPASVAADAGDYRCIVTDADGAITSDPSTVTVNSLQIDIDNLSGDFILCEGEQITLTASGASSYDWGIGFSTDNDIVRTPLTTTSYPVTGKDSNGCEASTSVQVVVNPLPTATVTSNGSICSGSDAVFEFTGTPGAEVIYRLNNTTDYTITLSSSGSFLVSIPNPSSNQTVSLVEVSNINCDVSLNITETVSVQTIPAEPAVTNLGPYCQGDPSFSIASLVTGTDLKWYLASSGGSSQSTPPTQNTTNPDTFYYYVSQTINGCESPRAEIEVVVNATPVISISGNNSICPGDTTILTASGGVSYDWGIPGETNDTISVSPTTTTTYSVIGTDANDCSSSAQITVTVNAEPTASLNAGSSPICSGEDAVFEFIGTPGAEVTYKLNAGVETNITLSSSG
ncbi:immunoglobulin domain-containing protein, partial [bacterium]|nr:immunoglobulin domain-containing protein [bacterium]